MSCSIPRDDDEKIFGDRVGPLAHFGDGLRERFLQAPNVVEELGAFFRLEEGAVVIALFAAELADLGNAHDDDGQRGIDSQSLELFSGKGAANVGEAG